MGRTDAVAFTNEWAARARQLGATVDFEPGWDTRGNGMAANYEGGLIHHTAFVSSQGNPFPARSTLINGRPDLSGPLCNVSAPWSADGSPRLVVISAQPANHAGASGGRSMGPLPVTGSFNARVFGLEIDYSGLAPMVPGQYQAALIFGRAICDVLGRSPEYIRAHAETSITGKWDPGFADGKTYDMAAFRSNVANFNPQGADMPLTDADVTKIMDWPFGPLLPGGPDLSFGQFLKAIPDFLQNATGGDLRNIVSLEQAEGQKIDAVSAKLNGTQSVNVDPVALAKALLADDASITKLGDAIAASLATRIHNG